MPDTHDKFHSAYGKRRILLVDDEAINRMMLGGMLEDQYDIVYAETAHDAVSAMIEHKDTLSLVLLDLILPDMHGLDVLRIAKADDRINRIPVIVVTSDKDAEVDSLNLGAIDFVPKPYPHPNVVHARVRRTIELCEDRDVMRWTERDQLTGLFNKEYFFYYASQADQYHKDEPYDAVVVDINHFHIINERYGRAYGDDVLKRVGSILLKLVRESGGMVCRREADTFLIYCPTRQNYNDILQNVAEDISDNLGESNRVRLRIGVYPNVDKSIDMERRFDRAKFAADSTKSNFTAALAYYNNSMHRDEIHNEQLIEEFPKAIAEKQFVIHYQPKYDVRGHEPVLTSAEALVRWKHPTMGMISPGEFIPLFETNGLIRTLDEYVWRSTAEQIRDWKNRLGISVPVSVNVSRMDIDENLGEHFTALLRDNDLTPDDLLLEITESAYTQDSDRIIKTVEQLRDAGFKVEMDDFGTGYSSLNMISTLPIDALKLDMQFIRNAFSERKDTRMLEIIIDIANSLGVPTISEGVETAEQMFTLKSMGCDIVQGYYFSRPIPGDEFEKFLIQKKEKGEIAAEAKEPEHVTRRSLRSQGKFAYDALHDPVTGLYNGSAYEMLIEDSDQEHIAILLASIDGFAAIRAEHGTDVSDRVLIRVADVLRQSFRSVDYICRIGSDEFVIIMTRVNSSMRQLVFDKVDHANTILQVKKDGIPSVSLSVGVAFADRENPQGDIFEDADKALYRMKEVKHTGCAIF